MKKTITILSTIIVILFQTSCGVKDYKSTSNPITHEIWDSLLQKHVTEEGQVDYQGIIQDSLKFNSYISLLKNNHPNTSNWSKDEQLAYWINAYNAFTVQLIVDNYPVKSIKDIKNGIPFVNTVWDIKFINIEGATYDLNNIEHGIIRENFKEPRIHFAVNCASVSCPRLRNEAFSAAKLDSQLADNARYFLANPLKNDFSNPDNLKLSKILKWYGGDFKGKKYGGVKGFIKKYGPQHSEDANIEYLDYDWNLNEKR
jgi:uncharacterized protein DUF547